MNKPKRLFLTGKPRAGKDYVAGQMGYTITSFSRPMYSISARLIGSKDKDQPGVRHFMQKIGQWGRGVVSEEYPRTYERDHITRTLRQQGARIAGSLFKDVDWKEYGRRDDFWIEALKSSLPELERWVRSPHALINERSYGVAVTGVRYPNEANALLDMGFAHGHVMAKGDTRRRRAAVSGQKSIDAFNKLEGDVSEEMNAYLDRIALEGPQRVPQALTSLPADLLQGVSGGWSVIWNDEEPPPEGCMFDDTWWIKGKDHARDPE